MAEEYDNQEKTEEPSAWRIEEFKRKGEVASSKELNSLFILTACTLSLSISITYVYEQLSLFVEWLYSLDLVSAYTEKSGKLIFERMLKTSLKCAAPVFFTVFCVSIISSIVQTGFIFSTEVLKWNSSRINPVKGMKKLFSIRSLLEAVKGFFKFLVILSIVYWFMKEEIFTLNGFFGLDFLQSVFYGKDLLVKLVFFILLGMSFIAVGDFAYQKYSYRKKLMLTKEQAKRELKEQEGNPEIKQRIKNIQKEMAQKRMISNVAGADVVVTNPTHFSVALVYQDKEMISPKVVAKGADHLALTIRRVAKKHDIPMVENVKLARTLYKTVKVGEFIPRELYKVVAEVLAFVYKLKKKKG